jgi:hypothetical protein
MAAEKGRKDGGLRGKSDFWHDRRQDLERGEMRAWRRRSFRGW